MIKQLSLYILVTLAISGFQLCAADKSELEYKMCQKSCPSCKVDKAAYQSIPQHLQETTAYGEMLILLEKDDRSDHDNTRLNNLKTKYSERYKNAKELCAGKSLLIKVRPYAHKRTEKDSFSNED